MSTLSNHVHALQPFFDGRGFLSIRSAGRRQLVLMVITLKPHGVFGSNAYLFILTLSSHLEAKQYEALSADSGHFVKMLIYIEPHGLF